MTQNCNSERNEQLELLLSCPICNNSLTKKSVSQEYAQNISELQVSSIDERVIKSGVWKIYENPQALSKTQIMSNKDGDKVTYSFNGRNIIVFFLRHDWSGVAEIKLDGKSVKKIDLYSQNYEYGYPCVIDAISDNQHTIDIIVTSQKNPRSIDNQVWIDGFGIFTTTYNTVYFCDNCKKRFPIVKGIVDFTKNDDEMACMYNTFIASSGDDHYGFNQLPEIAKVGHFLRIEILNGLLDEHTVKDAVAIDIGCGPWGFACIYPKLQKCRIGIGIDISVLALIRSNEKCGKFYYTASCENLPLKDQSVDIVFAGEVIEHVVNPEAFANDIFRVLKEDGILILTTPNPQPFFYRMKGLVYSESPEHISLMPYKKLIHMIGKKFKIQSTMGINLSIFPSLDQKIKNERILKLWSRIFLNWPDNATGIIIKCQKKKDPQ